MSDFWNPFAFIGAAYCTRVSEINKITSLSLSIRWIKGNVRRTRIERTRYRLLSSSLFLLECHQSIMKEIDREWSSLRIYDLFVPVITLRSNHISFPIKEKGNAKGKEETFLRYWKKKVPFSLTLRELWRYWQLYWVTKMTSFDLKSISSKFSQVPQPKSSSTNTTTCPLQYGTHLCHSTAVVIRAYLYHISIIDQGPCLSNI